MKKMHLKLNTLKSGGKDWFKERAYGNYTKFWLALLSFSESSFFLIPPDVLLIAIILSSAKRWFYYALFTATFSVLGAIAGYFIGFYFFDLIGVKIISFYNLEEETAKVANLFSDNSFWVMFTAAFTPIPYKVFVLTGGFFKVNFWLFLIGSILGRAMRFIMVAYVVKRYKEKIAYTVFNYFNLATYLVCFVIIIFILFNIL